MNLDLASDMAGKVWNAAENRVENKKMEFLEQSRPDPDEATGEAVKKYEQELADTMFLSNSYTSIGNWYYFIKGLQMGADPGRLYEHRILNLAGRRTDDGQYISNTNREKILYLAEKGLIDINETRKDMNNLLTEQMNSLPMAEWYLQCGASPDGVREHDGFTVLEQVFTDSGWENKSVKHMEPLLAEQVQLLFDYGAKVTDRTMDLAIWAFFNPDNKEIPDGTKNKYARCYKSGRLEFSVFRQLWSEYKNAGGSQELPEEIRAAIEDDTDALLEIQRKKDHALSEEILACIAGIGSPETIKALSDEGADFIECRILKAAIVGGKTENVKALAELHESGLDAFWDDYWLTAFDFALRYAKTDMIRYLYENTEQAVPISNFNLDYEETRADGKTCLLPSIPAGGRKKWVDWHTEDALYVAGARRSEELLSFILNETEYPDDPARLSYAYGGRNDGGAQVDGGAFLTCLLERGLDPKSRPCNVIGEGEADPSDMLGVIALRNGNWQDFELFCLYGFDVKPYLAECLHGVLTTEDEDHSDVLRWLLEQGADPNAIDILEYKNQENGEQIVKEYDPLQRTIVSARPDYLRILKEYGAEYVQERGKVYEYTDLYYATQMSDVWMDTELLEEILKLGADPNIRLSWNANEKLQEDDDPYYYNVFTWMMRKYLHMTERKDGIDGVIGWAAQKLDPEQKASSDAECWYYREVMKNVFTMLIRYGGDPGAEDGRGRTIRRMAAEAGEEGLLDYLGI